MNLPNILRDIQDPATTPGKLSEIQMHLSAEYASLSDEFGKVVIKNKLTWNALKLTPAFTTDKQVDKHIDGTLDGQAEITLRLQLKSLEKLMSAIKTHLRLKENEARNMY